MKNNNIKISLMYLLIILSINKLVAQDYLNFNPTPITSEEVIVRFSDTSKTYVKPKLIKYELPYWAKSNSITKLLKIGKNNKDNFYKSENRKSSSNSLETEQINKNNIFLNKSKNAALKLNYSASFIQSITDWKWALNFNLNSFDSLVKDYATQNFRIDDIDAYGGGLFAGCWLHDNYGWVYIANADYNTFLDFLNTHSDYRIKDIEVFLVNNQPRYCAVFIQDNQGWEYFINSSNGSDFNTWLSSQEDKGNYIVDIDVYSLNGTLYWSGIACQLHNNAWAWCNNYSASDFFNLAEQYNNDGFVINQLELTYIGNEYLYSATWEKYNLNTGGYLINESNQQTFVNDIKNRGNSSNRPIMFNILESEEEINQSGNFWEQTNGPFGVEIYCLLTNSKDHLFAGSNEGIFRSTDNGDNWTKILESENDPILTLATNQKEYIFAGTSGGQVYRSTNNGTTWQHIDKDFKFGDIGFSILCFVIVSDTIYLGSNLALYRSINDGENWVEVDDGTVLSLAATPEGDILAGNFGEITYFSKKNNGFLTLNNGLPEAGIISLDLNSNRQIFAATSGKGMFRSTNSGINWYPINTGISDLNVKALIINSKDQIFIGSESGGVFLSTNNGANWSEKNDGLTSKNILSLILNSDGKLFAGTNNNGVFRSTSTITSIINNDVIPSGFKLEQNYPNPFNPSTTIKYSIPRTGFITLKVYDILGKEVATLVNEEKPVGNYEINFNASNLASGVYFYRIKAGEYINTKKLILLK